MAKLGSPVTNRFSISEAEVRIGPVADAGKLIQAHSLGLLDSATVEFTVESEDLEGGLPRVTFDTAITRQSAQISLAAREYSRKNIEIFMGEAPAGTLSPDFASTFVGALTAASTTITIAGDATQIKAGDLVGVYLKSAPENISLVRATADGVGNDITFDPVKTPINVDVDTTTITGDIGIFFALKQVPLGNLTETNYFSCMVLGKDRQGRPKGFNFYKCAMSSGLNVGFSADTFGSTDATIKVLQPALSEYAAGGALEHLAELIPTHPLGYYFGGGDA